MAEHAEEIEHGLERIHARLQELERRVATLEERPELPANAHIETQRKREANGIDQRRAGAWQGGAGVRGANVRSHRSSHFASMILGLTATLILPPLLWEGTVRASIARV